MVFKSSKKEDKKSEDTYIVSTEKTVEEETSRSFIGKTMNIEADITSDEDVTVEGKVTGNISISKTLTIGKNGSVKADINASVVRIIGEARGNITASKKVEILSQGRFTGNIQSQKLVIADGAILNGTINQSDAGS